MSFLGVCNTSNPTGATSGEETVYASVAPRFCPGFKGVIGSYMRSWERPGDLPRLIEILCPFASGAQRNEQKETKISITSGRSPGLSQQRM